MQKISSTEALKETILLLEIKQLEEARRVKEEFHLIYENLRPINIIKNSLTNAVGIPDLRGNLLNLALGNAAGFLSKMVFVRGSGNPVKRILGAALQYGIGNYVAKHPEGIKSGLMNGIKGVMRKIKDRNSDKDKGDKLYYDIE